MSSTTTPCLRLCLQTHHPHWEGTRVRGWSKVKLLSCGNSVWHSLISWIFHILLQTLKRVCPGAGPARAIFTTRVSGISIFGFKTDQQPKGQSGEWVGSCTFLFLLKPAGCTPCRARLSKTRMPTTDGRASLSFQTSCGSANSGNAWELLKKKRASWGSDYRSMLAAATTVFICFVVQSSGALAVTTACWDERQPEAEGNSSCICEFVAPPPWFRDK